MYRSFLVALWCVLTVSVALAQDKPAPEQLAKIGPTVHAPVPTQQPEAEMPDEARKAQINGICLVSLIVDLEGEPTNVRIIRCTDPIFAKNSMEAVAKYRFKPAVRITDGNPVPVKLIIEVNFRFTDRGFDPAELWVSSLIRYGFSSPPDTTSVGPDAIGVYPLTKQMELPEIVAFVSQGFGNAAKPFANGMECHLVMTIDANGKAKDIDLKDCSQDKVRRPAVDSLLKSKYLPARLNGKPVPTRLMVHLIYLGLGKLMEQDSSESGPSTSKP